MLATLLEKIQERGAGPHHARRPSHRLLVIYQPV